MRGHRRAGHRTALSARYLETLARDTGEDVDAGLTKAHASECIEELQWKTGRG